MPPCLFLFTQLITSGSLADLSIAKCNRITRPPPMMKIYSFHSNQISNPFTCVGPSSLPLLHTGWCNHLISLPFISLSFLIFFGSLKNKDGSSLPHCIIVIIGVVYDDGYSWVPVLQKPLKHCHGHLWTNLISLTSPTSLVCEKKLNFFIKIFSGGGSLLQGGKVKKKNGCEFVHREGREPLLLGLAIIVLVWTDLFISFTHLRHLLRILYICSLPHNLLPPYASLLPLTASLLFVDWPDLLFGHSPSLNIG